MNKFFRGILVLIIVIGGFYFSPIIDAQVKIPDTSELFQTDSAVNLAETSNIKDYTSGSSDDGATQFRTLTIKLTNFLRELMGPIAVLLLVYGGVELYLTHGNEEKYKQTINQIAGIGTGFLLMLIAVNLVDWVFFGREGEIFRGNIDPADLARRGMIEIRGLFDYITAFAVIVAVAFIVWNAITLVITGGEDEAQISATKKKIIYSIIGIVIMVSVKSMVEMITDYDGGLTMPSIELGVTLVARWVNFILGLIGVFAVIAIIYAGIRLILHFGDEEATTQAKNIVMGAIIGLIITFSSWTIIHYFISPS